MWSVKAFLSRWKPFENMLAEVVYEAPPADGQVKGSLVQWRLKRRANDGKLLISLKLIADYAEGPEGRMNNYIDFMPGQVKAITDGLALCLAERERLRAVASPAP